MVVVGLVGTNTTRSWGMPHGPLNQKNMCLSFIGGFAHVLRDIHCAKTHASNTQNAAMESWKEALEMHVSRSSSNSIDDNDDGHALPKKALAKARTQAHYI